MSLTAGARTKAAKCPSCEAAADHLVLRRALRTGLAATAFLGASVCFLLAGTGERTAALLVWYWQTNALLLSLLVGASSLTGGALLALAPWIRGKTLLRTVARAAIRGSGGTLVLMALLAALQSGQATATRTNLSDSPASFLPLAALLVACGAAALVRVLSSLRNSDNS